jgi:hypothetical protein
MTEMTFQFKTFSTPKKAVSKPAQPKTTTTTPKLALVPTPYDLMLDDLRKSGLDADDAKLLHLKPYSAKASEALKLPRGPDAGYQIPYHDERGKVLRMWRYRFFKVVSDSGFTVGAKLDKYNQSSGSPVEIYLSPQKNWEKEKAKGIKRLLFVEGEKKAACAIKNDFLSVGLGGVWSFGRGKGDLRLHKTLTGFQWPGCDAYICFDSDAAKNPDIVRAENRLADLLVNEGALAHVVRIPPDGDAKIGPDDFIVKHGKKAFEELLDKAFMWKDNQHLHQLNEQYVVCRNPASIYEIETFTMYSKQDFVGIIEAPRKMKEIVPPDETRKAKTVSAAKLWVEWPQRGKVDGVTYDPGQPRIFKGKLNQWNDPGIEAHQGNTTPFDELFEHLVPDKKQRAWIMQWTAYPLQHRGERNNTAVLLWSKTQGQGKSLLGETLGLLHGKENYIEIKPGDIVGSFNEWRPRRTFIMGSELCGTTESDTREFEDLLKALITETDIWANAKFEKKYRVPNRANYWLTSNRSTALHLTKEARRFFVIHATEEKLKQDFYKRFVVWRDNGGLSALLFKLSQVDLTGFDPGADAPHTKAMDDMVERGRSDLQAWVAELSEDHPTRVASLKQLLNAYKDRTPNTRINQQHLLNELKDAGFKQVNSKNQTRIYDTRGKDTGLRERLWIIRDKVDEQHKKRISNMTEKEISTEWWSADSSKYARPGGGGA